MNTIIEFLTIRNLGKPLLYIGTVSVQILAMMIVLLVSLAFILLFDRKVWAAVQLRKGPNVVGPFGLLQSFADFIKFALKEIIIPAGADKPIFLLAPILSLVTAFLTWTAIPVAPGVVISDFNMGILFIFAISSLGVYGIIIGGWASNSKYPFLGAMRSSAQMISYEVSLGFVFLCVILLTGSLNLSDIVMAQERGYGLLNWYVWPLFPIFIIFFISALAETNRPPFDLPEAESELVAGYQVEYSSTPYLLFMIAEYLNIVLMCALLTILFLGGWNSPINIDILNSFPIIWFSLKVILMFFFFAMTKAIVPRYRYDQLMRIGWKIFLPFNLVFLVVLVSLMMFIPEVSQYFSGWRG